MRPLDFLGRIKVKIGMVMLLAVAAAFVANEVGINAGYPRNVRVAVAVAFALVMMQLLARGMTKPLREMAAAAQTIAKGRYGLRVAATSRDEVGELARAFNAMAADLGEVDRQRRELVANVSHELRTPITALRAVLENVVDGVSTPDPVTLGTALSQTERLGRLVAQLLDLSRLDSGARPIELEEVELRPLCEQALREAVLAREGVTARCEVPAGLSAHADPDLLAQVLANLLDNAVRHSPAGGVVVLGAAPRENGVRLRVTDQGPGIPQEDRARAFERFSRLDAGRAADVGGAGLGLAIVKEIVELHGGCIHVEDGGGCRVVVDLPESSSASTLTRASRGPADATGRTGATGGARLSQDEAPVEGSGFREIAGSETPGNPAKARGEGPRLPETAESTGDSGVEALREHGDSDEAGKAVPSSEGTGSPEITESGKSAGLAHRAGGTGENAKLSDAVEGGLAGPRESAGAAGFARYAEGDGEPPRRTEPGAVEPSAPGEPHPSSANGPVAGESRLSSERGPVGGPYSSSANGPVAGESSAREQPRAGESHLSSERRPAVGGSYRSAAWGPMPGAPRRSRPPRNWAGAFAGLFGGGIAGLVCGVVTGLIIASMSPLLGALAGFLITLGGGFVGTVLGITDSYARAAGSLPERPVIPRPAGHGSGPWGARATGATRETTGGERGTGSSGGSPDGTLEGLPAGTSESSPGSPFGGPSGKGSGGPPGGYVAPPLFPRPELPATPRWMLAAGACVGLVAALALPYSRIGLGFVLVAVAMGVAVLPVARHRITPWSAGLGVVAYGLVTVAVFRDSDWLVASLLLAGFLLAALALSGVGRGWLGVVRGAASVLIALPPVPWFLAESVKGASLRRRVVPALVGVGLSLVLVLLFGGLFVSADAVFADAVERILLAQDWAASMPVRIVLFAVFGVLVAAAVLVGLRPVAEPRVPTLRLTVGRSLWVPPLVALNLLFAVFVGMQLTVLFGSTRWVVSAVGLTYAEYARSGFFQLVIVSVFVLAIVAAASVLVDLGGRERWLMAGLLGLLCALTLVVLASALHRLDLYVDAYGFSRLRASVEAAIWWLGAVFVLVLAAGAVRLTRRGHAGWLPRAMVMMTGVALLAFAVWNPDLRVAETQVAIRGVERLDQAYLGDLGAEAVPALDRLPEPMRSCVLRDVVAANDLAAPDPWNGWNLARQRARDLLAERPVLSGPECATTSSRGPYD
ncbi:DUF4153 domain-containing protein [Streptosporangium jomthongense]|uniref:Signal transduction histidine-protein kinase/phosphatase MprB n=1 Tax=Streptosporangium jomthongense TaxID=1193683 RepID=A0ABV8F7C8_9ACTN